MMNKQLKKLIYAAICLALCYVLPFLTLGDVTLGTMFSLMHIPVFLCGFLCGWQWGLAVGFVAPLLRSLTLSRPPILPTGLAMAFELAAYGLVVGLLFKVLPRKAWSIYVSLIVAMLLGRVVSGVANAIILGIQGNAYTFEVFLAKHFVEALPAIVLHIIFVPLVVMAFERAKLIENNPKRKE
ncbi:MAG: ECF transporter S component [Clostridia bacterium]|nr:ECF transporter S component [Clostridia bacterium]